MRILHDQAPFSITHFQGDIEAIGLARQFQDGQHFAYVRINDEIGGPTILQDLSADNAVGSYLREGVDCHLFTLNWGGRERLIFAIETQGQQVFRPTELKRLKRLMARQVMLVWGAATATGLLLSLLVIFAYIGVPLAVWAGWKLAKGLKRSALPIETMASCLLAEGWHSSKVQFTA